MRQQRSGTIDPILERTFRWLRDLGFTAEADPDMTVGATFATDAVLVRPTYHWHDEYADVTISRSWTPEPGPYWAQVHLSELLERAPGMNRRYNGMVRDERVLEEVFGNAATLLREVAQDQLAGRNLELLDDIIAKRPHLGVPGLDFPVVEPWAASQEGLWFTTDFSGPPPEFAGAMDRTVSSDAIARATAALQLRPGLAEDGRESALAFGRLVELLGDPDPDVRRAAASSLSEWRELSVLDTILNLLTSESGESPSPFAAAATFLATEQAPELRQRVRDALDQFASRGQPAREQVAELRWRLDDRPRRYPRVTEVWQSGSE
jgi:hypothetical protein